MVELDVEFVEVSKSSLDRIGARWPTDLDAQLSLEYSSTTVLRGQQPDLSRFSAQAAGSASFGLSLQFNDGVTRTLARPRLVTASTKKPNSWQAGSAHPCGDPGPHLRGL